MMMKVIRELEDLRKTFTYTRHPTIGDPIINVGKVVTESIGIGLRPVETPHTCKADLDMRYVPGMTVQSIVKDIERVFLNLWVKDPDFEAAIEVWPRSYNLPPPEVPRDSRVAQIVANAHREVFNQEASFVDEETPYRYYWTDTCVLNGISKIPTINYGPGGEEASVRPDERVSIPQLVAGAKVYALAALEACGVT